MTASPRRLLLNEAGSLRKTHIDSGGRSMFRGKPTAITLCGRYLDHFSVTDPTADAPTCGQCARRKARR